MNDNSNKKQRKFYTNCPLADCKEKITVSINSSEERIERKAEERLEEELVKHWISKKHSWENAEGLEFKVTEETEENKPVERREKEEDNRPRNWGTHGNSSGTNLVGGERKCPKCGMTKIIVPSPSNPNPDLNAIWQKHEQNGECSEKQQTDHYKCLKCGNVGAVSDLGMLGNSGWCKCGSKNLECWSGNFHWTTFECPSCHKFRDYKYHGLSPEHEARIKAQAKLNWENVNQWCVCPRSNVSNQTRERERERESVLEFMKANNIKSISLTNNGNLLVEYSNGTNQTTSANSPQLQQAQSYLQNQGKKSVSQDELQAEVNSSQSNKNKTVYWIFGGIVVVLLALVGILVYFLLKKQKEKER